MKVTCLSPIQRGHWGSLWKVFLHKGMGDELEGKAERLSRKKLIGYTKRQGPQGEEIVWHYSCRRMKSGEVGMKGHGYPVPEQVLCATFTLTI